jgi:hypothetical protein
MARAFEVPMYRLFTVDEHVKKPNTPAEAIRSLAVRTKNDRASGRGEITLSLE